MFRISVLAALLAGVAAMPAAAGPSKQAANRAHETPAAEKADRGQRPSDTASGDATTFGSGAAIEDSGTVGTGGSAAAGGTSASTLGLGATSTGDDGETASTLGTGGTAAAVDGRATSRTNLVDNQNMLMGQSRAQAMDQGTFSKSHTRTKVRKGEELESRTKSMSHVPGEKPEMSTTTWQVDVQ